MSLPPVFAASALYDSLLQAALRQFFGRATFETEPIPSLSSDGRLAIEPTGDPSALASAGSARGTSSTCRRRGRSPRTRCGSRARSARCWRRATARFSTRKQMLERGDLFRGAIEDRYVARLPRRGGLPADPRTVARRSHRHRDRGPARRGALELREPRDLLRRAVLGRRRDPVGAAPRDARGRVPLFAGADRRSRASTACATASTRCFWSIADGQRARHRRARALRGRRRLARRALPDALPAARARDPRATATSASC